MPRLFPRSFLDSNDRLAKANADLDEVLVSLTMKNERVDRAEAQQRVNQRVQREVAKVTQQIGVLTHG